MSVVAIGATPTIDSMMLLGFKVIKVPEKLGETTQDEVLSVVLESKVVVIEEPVYAQISDRLGKLLSYVKEPPLLVIVPSHKQPSTRRLEELYQKLSYAVGVRLRWVRRE
uniref:V-type ATP synthase subunit F n=1 Tax=Thermofilum pendens TaxID=2269 RepID=A0A7C4B9X3_THEPE